MKKLYIKDILKDNFSNDNVEIYGWIAKIRKQKENIFVDLADSTGFIQIVFEKEKLGELSFNEAKQFTVESALLINGTIKEINSKFEVVANSFEIIAKASMILTPHPRSDFNIFDERFTHQILSNKHIYLRNPKLMAIQRFRNLMLYTVRKWFFDNNYIEIAAPVLTPVSLYDDKTVIPVKLQEQDLFLSQCVGYYLESASMAHEKVYNISPSFRGEEGRSKRHLLEYWHIKAELAFGDLEDIISIVEALIKYLTEEMVKSEEVTEIFKILGTSFCTDGLKAPYPRISYDDAIKLLNESGVDIEYGKSISSNDEEILSKKYDSPVWLTGIPRKIEPFPYSIDENRNDLTMVADLIASNGFGELLGVAEKIYQIDMLDERMNEKGKLNDNRYEWIRETHMMGCVPHIAFGMGVERLIRWLMNIPHVRDAHPFPRVFGRKIRV